MIIHFGLHLDGMQPAPPATQAGILTAGPQRLLKELEQQLGLPLAAARPGEALLAYRSCLEDLDTPSRFYHASFGVDSLGVARTLLRWRAAWYEAGWHGDFKGPVSHRLADLADVERLAQQRVPLCAGQRVQRISAALEQGLRTQIERIVLHDELEALPAVWQSLLKQFDYSIAEGVAPAPRAEPDTDLFKLQEILSNVAARPGTVAAPLRRARLRGDSSLIVLRGVSRDLSAQALGEHLRAIDAPDETVLIAEHDGIIVDNALERVGLPRAGFQHYSRFRAVTQVLKLALSLVWKPLGPRALLQFLLHPVGPLPLQVRSALAEAVAAEPGVGGRTWQSALDRIAERERERADGDEASTQKEAEKRIAALREEVAWWLEGERYAPDEGAPVQVLIERAQRCTSWLVRRSSMLTGSERDLYAAAIAQSEALIDALARLAERGAERVPRLMLERLVDEVTGHSPDPSTFAEAGRVRATDAPETITRAWDTVIWWDLAPHTQRIDYPWSEAELAELKAEGVALLPVEDVIAQRNRAWTRPVLNARKRLILAVHESDEGRHPLWSRIVSVAEGFNELRVEDALLGGENALAALDVSLEPLEQRALPEKRRWWRLPPEVRIPRRESESYSSLQKLVYSPHEWVLQYAARLAPGRAANIAGDALLYGNLAHRLFEAYFERFPDGRLDEHSAERDADLRQWLARELPALVEREAAVLDEPGMGVTRERVLATIEHALYALLLHFKQAGIVRVISERPHDVPFETGAGTLRLRGSIDLLLEDAHGREIVLDVKWGGAERRGREIAENRALQLAAYAYMRSRETGDRWPPQGYFIVTTGDIIASDTRVFPNAIPFPPDEPLTSRQLWERLGRTYDWRMAQLDAGAIEINAAGTEPEPLFEPPEEGLETDAAPNRYDEFASLLGWEPGE